MVNFIRLVSIWVMLAADLACGKGLIETWVKEYSRGEGALPLVRLAVVEEPQANKKLSFVPTNKHLFDNYGFMELAEPRASEWNFLLNQNPCIKKKVEPLQLAANIGNLDLLVTLREGGGGAILQRREDALVQLSDLNAKGTHARQLYPAIEEALGFNGIVLEMKNNMILAVASESKLRSRAQGIVISGSVSQMKFPRVIEDGDALVEVTEARGRLAVLKIVIANAVEKIVPGSKLRIK